MTAALTAKREGLDALVLEKCEYYGGSTAISGGGIWIPNNHLMPALGINDSADNALTYMENTVGNRTPKANQQAFIKYAPEMIRCLDELPHMAFRIVPEFCDYYPERPGGMTSGRGLDSPVFSGKKLGELFDHIRIRPITLLFDIIVTLNEGRKLALSRAYPVFLIDVFKIALRNLSDKIFRTRHIAMGGAIIARLRLSLHECNVPVWLNTTVTDIIFEDGAAVGVEVDKEGEKIRIRAARGIMLAAGGFARNQRMREHYQKHPVDTAWTGASPGDTGEVIEMGINAGADVDLMDDSWGMPTILPPDEYPLPLVFERAYPGAILVNAAGCRFTNESASYVDVAHAMYEANSENASAIPSFLVLDQRNRDRHVLGTMMPGHMRSRYLESGFIIKADTLEELADKMGINSAGLLETVKRCNEFARTGKDLDFGRGESAYDRFYSDPTAKPNCCLAPIEKSPFYGVKVYPGDIGTKGGLRTNERAQVLNTQGDVIPGLYAAGNCSASVMGNTYPGPGSTIGPAMTFGYIGAKHAAGRLKCDEVRQRNAATANE